MSRWAVVLAGGVGSRFWPLSTPNRPKQLLPLVNDAPLLDNTLARLAPLVPPERTLLLTNASLAEPICALCRSLPRENVIAEPKPAGTAAALAWAAAEIERRAGSDAVMICVHADWAIGDDQGFRDTLARAAEVAERSHALVTVGIVPSRPDPGFGYIQPADEASGADAPHQARRVARFVEKPDRANAERMVRDCDADGNALSGLVHALQATGNVVHAEGNAVVLYGVADLVVVTRDGLTLVTTVDRSAELKTLIDSLPAGFRARE